MRTSRKRADATADRRSLRKTSGVSLRTSDARPGLARTPKSEAWGLLVFLASVFLLKLVVMLQLKDHILTQPDAGLDTAAYVALAGRVLHGDVALGPGLYFVSPLYIYFLAGVLSFWRSFTVVRLVQIALGTASVGFVFVAGREWFGRRAA